MASHIKIEDFWTIQTDLLLGLSVEKTVKMTTYFQSKLTTHCRSKLTTCCQFKMTSGCRSKVTT